MYFIGLDLGTSGVKAVLMDQSQTILGSSQQSLTLSRPHPGWSEQQPDDWIKAAGLAMDDLKVKFPLAMGMVEGISLSGQMHGATLLDKDKAVLRPCMLWNDTRSAAEAQELDMDPQFRAITGNIVFPGFTAPKLLWVKRNEPRVFEKVRQVLLPKDYLRLWLSGDSVSEMSDASGTAWLDTANRCWSDSLLAATDLDITHMPRLVEGTEYSGRLRQELQSRWGMQKSPSIIGGAGDNAAAACGMGVVNAGSAFVSLGTSGVLFAASDRYQPRPESAVHTFCHALPSTWHQMGVILSATDSLNWYANICGHSAQSLTAELGSSLFPASRVTFLPYLSGERTPHNDAKVRGVFAGLHHDADRKDLTHAVLEGVCYAIRDNLHALRSTGTEINEVIAVGGGSRSVYWLKLLATILNIPVVYPEEGDFGAAFGAARLALIGACGEVPQSICTPPAMVEQIEPNSALLSEYEESFEKYRSLYPLVSRFNR